VEFIYFLIRQVPWPLVVLIGLSMTIVVIARVMPGDPARMALGPRASRDTACARSCRKTSTP
jgi:peptide/nickel transport system permease protein